MSSAKSQAGVEERRGGVEEKDRGHRFIADVAVECIPRRAPIHSRRCSSTRVYNNAERKEQTSETKRDTGPISRSWPTKQMLWKLPGGGGEVGTIVERPRVTLTNSMTVQFRAAGTTRCLRFSAERGRGEYHSVCRTRADSLIDAINAALPNSERGKCLALQKYSNRATFHVNRFAYIRNVCLYTDILRA